MVDFKNIQDLGGLFTSAPEDKIADRNASDLLNIDFSQTGLIQTSGGFEEFANGINAAGNGLRGFLYKKNFGTLKRILLRVRDDGTNSHLEWLNPSNPSTDDGKWETLVANLTQGAVMGFAAFNNTNVNQLMFCNGKDNMSQWNGATGLVASVTSTTIVIEETIASEGFNTTSGSIVIDGTEYAYTGTSGSTFTGVTPDPTSQNPAAKTGVVYKPDTSTLSGNPKGNILLTASARLWVAGVDTRESTLYYSEVGDATNFAAGINPDDPGIEDFPDGGGPITLLESKDNSKIIIHKEDGILVFELTYTETGKVPNLQVLTLADDSGASTQKAGAGLNNVTYFTTNTEGLKSLQRALDDSNLNLESITDIILPTIENYDFSDAASIYYPKKRVIFVACKSSSSVNFNDMMIAYYIRRSLTGNFVGDLSIFNSIKAADFILDRKTLYYISSVDQNVYKMFGRNSAKGVGVIHSYTTKSFTFGEPAIGKEFHTVYIEGLISNGTKIKISVLYGILGSDNQKEIVLEWNNSKYVATQKISALGTEVIGTTSLGASNSNILDSYPFSVPIQFNPLRNTRYKIKMQTEYDEETVDDTYWAVSNISTNPTLKGIDTNKQISAETV